MIEQSANCLITVPRENEVLTSCLGSHKCSVFLGWILPSSNWAPFAFALTSTEIGRCRGCCSVGTNLLPSLLEQHISSRGQHDSIAERQLHDSENRSAHRHK